MDIRGKEYQNTSASGNAQMHNGDKMNITNNYYGYDPVLFMPFPDTVSGPYTWMQSKTQVEKDQLLVNAVSRGQVSHAEALINAGADVNCRMVRSNSAFTGDITGGLRPITRMSIPCNLLHIAVLKNDPSCMNMLLAQGADLFARVNVECLLETWNYRTYSFTILGLALASRFYSLIPSLLQRGAAREIGIVSQAISKAVPLDLLKSIIAAGGSVNDCNDSCTWPLLEALVHGESNPEYCGSVVDLLLSKGADANAAAIQVLPHWWHAQTIVAGSTALMVAAFKRLFPVMKALLNHGAEINKEDGEGNTVLMHLYRRCYNLPPCSQQDQLKMDEILDLLLHSGADVEYRNMHSDNFYYYAITNGCCGYRHLKRLHAAGARFNREHSPVLCDYVYRNVPYQRHQKPETCKVVIDILEIVGGINEMNSRGRTALMHAAWHGWLDIVKILLDHEADMEVKDETGLTALAHAAHKPYTRIVRLLLERGASFDTGSEWPKRINDIITRIRLKRLVEVPFSRRSTSSRPSPFNFSDGADRCSVTPSVWTDISSRAESVYSFCEESPEPEQFLKVETPGVFTTGTPSMGRIVEAEDSTLR